MDMLSKLAESIEAGDVMIQMNEEGYDEYWTVECVEIDESEGIVWVDFDKGQDAFATGYMIDYYKL